MSYSISKNTIEKAASVLEGQIHRTPVLTSSALNDLTCAQLFFKCENFQKTGMTHIVAVSGYNVAIIAEYVVLLGLLLVI